MKRSTHSDLRVVHYQPGQRLRQFLILLVFSVAAGAIGFVLGMAQAEFRGKDAVQTRAVLAGQVAQLRSENTQLRQALLKLERGSQIDQQAILEAQRTMTRLETTISQLSSDLGFYKNIMAPGEVDKNLQVQRVSVSSLTGANRFSYKLSLTQVGDNSSYIEGLVAVNIIGQRKGEKEVIPLRDISDSVDTLGIKFRFRYFQDIEGALVLPEGFEAEAVQIIAQAEGEKAARVERTFGWRKLIGE